MKLSEELLKDFAKTVVPREARVKQDKIAYGTVRIVDGQLYVQFDGATVNTPASQTVEVKHGDRVMALLKDRKAVITGNVTTPIARGAATFFQNTEPSSDNRKLGDIWFDTGNGYRMKTWNGTEWSLAQFDYQALNVASLSAISANLGSINAGEININNKFKVSSTGYLEATGAKVSGQITAGSGVIAGLEIGSNTDGQYWLTANGLTISPFGISWYEYWDETEAAEAEARGEEYLGSRVEYAAGDFHHTTALNINDVFRVSTTGDATLNNLKIGGLFTFSSESGLHMYLQNGIPYPWSDVDGVFSVGNHLLLSDYSFFSGLIMGTKLKIANDGTILSDLESKGQISVIHEDTTNSYFKIQNSVRNGRFVVNSVGRIGIYNDTENRWLFYDDGTAFTIPSATTVSGKMTFTNAPVLKNNYYLMGTNTDGDTVPLIGWSSGDNMWVGNYTFADRSNRITLGITSDKLYCYNSSGSQVLLSTAISDQRLKHDISDLKGFKDFIMGLNPKRFKINNEASDRYHFGFIAQDVRPLMESTVGDSIMIAYNPNDVEKDIYDPNDESTFEYSMDYTQFIAPLIALVQEQERRIEELERGRSA